MTTEKKFETIQLLLDDPDFNNDLKKMSEQIVQDYMNFLLKWINTLPDSQQSEFKDILKRKTFYPFKPPAFKPPDSQTDEGWCLEH